MSLLHARTLVPIFVSLAIPVSACFSSDTNCRDPCAAQLSSSSELVQELIWHNALCARATM
eukprot:m.62218 g.62218  ORF g.62218 m.62218 type:complete len:61 (-) comp12391_c2_seq1:1223-1405(-)